MCAVIAGISEENLNKLVQHAQIPHDEQCVIPNMQHLNIPIIQDVSVRLTSRAASWHYWAFINEGWQWLDLTSYFFRVDFREIFIVPTYNVCRLLLIYVRTMI